MAPPARSQWSLSSPSAGELRAFERIAEFARHAFDVPIAGILVKGRAAVAAESDTVAISEHHLRTLCAALMASGKPVLVEDLGQTHAALARDTGLHFVAAVPIYGAQMQRIGTVCIAAPSVHTPDPGVLDRLITLAGLVGGDQGGAPVAFEEDAPHRKAQPVDHGIVITDSDAQIVWASEGFAQLCGYPLDELIGHAPQDLLQGPATDEEVVASIRSCVRGERGFEAELVNYRKSGEPYWVHIQAEPLRTDDDRVTGFIALETEVTGRKTLGDTLRTSTFRSDHDLLEATLDAVEAPVVLLDPEGRIIWVSSVFCRLTGFSAEDVKGQPIADVLVPEREHAQIEAALAAHRAGQARYTFEGHWQTASGGRRLIDWSSTALLDAHDTLRYIVATGIDITERRQLKQRILQVSDEERRRIGQDLHDMLASQLAGTAMMAKSLRGPIALRPEAIEEVLDEIVEQIHAAAQQVRALSHSLMPVRLEEASLEAALRQLAENKEAITGVPHAVDVAADLPPLHDAAVQHLYRIAYEAASNAVKHADPSRVHIQLTRTDTHVVLSVRDDGVGLPQGSGADAGRGLHLMHHRANVIGAELQVRSADPHGTVVQCALPIDRATAAPYES